MKTMTNCFVLMCAGWAGAAGAGEMMTFPTNSETLSDRDADRGSLEIDGVTLSLTAGVNTEETPTLLPVTAHEGKITGIGVRSKDSRWGAVQRGESLTLTFDHDVVVRELDLALVGLYADTAVTVTVGQNDPFRVYGKKSTSTVEPAVEGVTFEGVQDIITFAGDGQKVAAGDAILLSFDESNTEKKGFVLSGLTVERLAAPLVEEPG